MRIYKFAVVALACLPTLSFAMDRNTISLERLQFEYDSFRHHQVMGGSIRTESPVLQTQGQWAFLAALGGGRVSQDMGRSYDRLYGQLGLKRYVTSTTTLTAAGGYEWNFGSQAENYEVGSVAAKVRQSLTRPDYPLVPYLRANGILQFIQPSFDSPARQEQRYELLVIELLGGLEIRTEKNLRWVFEGGRSQSKALDNGGPDLADGWLLRIAMLYDWF